MMSKVHELFRIAGQAIEAREFEKALRYLEELQSLDEREDPMSNALRRTFCYFAWANLGMAFPPARTSLEAILAQLQNLPGGDENKEKDIKAISAALGYVRETERNSKLQS